ncbi:MAG: hypothetical protein ACLPY4_07665 [Methanoregula sp.]
MNELIGIVVGTLLGFLLSYVLEWIKKRNLIKGYSVILQSELRNLKECKSSGLDDVLKNYNYICGLVEKQISTTLIPKKNQDEPQDPSEFLKRWAFRQKYAFLRNNLDKLYLFKPDTVTSMLKVYDYMEEFEQLRNGDPQLILPNNLEHAQNEIPITISLLEKEPVF